MRYKKWVIVLSMMVIAAMALAACQPAAPEVVEVVIETVVIKKEGETVVETVVVEKEVVVEVEVVDPDSLSPYVKVPPDLCPPDIECEGELKFDNSPKQEIYGGIQVQEVWVQNGLHANVQGELFRMNVIGVNKDYVEHYTQNVKVCFDQIFTEEVTADESPEPRSDLLLNEFGVNSGDLIIEVYPIGFIDPTESSQEVIETLISIPTQEWAGVLEEMGFSFNQARPEELKQNQVVDLVIDPDIENGSTHYYPQLSAIKALAVVSVAEGGGSVKADLLRDVEIMRTKTVERGNPPAPDTDTLFDEFGTRTTYYLRVTGIHNSNHYRMSERIGWPGWHSYYNEPAPKCTMEDICLKLNRGQSTTFPIRYTTEEMPIPKVDVLLLFDVTASMGEEIDEVKGNASYIMETVKEKVDAAFGVGSFADYPGSYDYAGYAEDYGAEGDYPWSLDLDITTDTDAVKWALDSLELRDGVDFPESYSRALFEAINVSWRADTKKVIVLFGDAVAHDYEFFLDEFGVNYGVDPGEDNSPGTPDDLAFSNVVEDLKYNLVTVIPINSAPASKEIVSKFFDHLAEETGGQVYTLTAATEAPEAVVRGLEAATEQINELTISTAPDFSSWLTSEPPIYYNVGGGVSLPFDVTITVPEDIAPGLEEFDLILLGDGAQLNVFHVVLYVPQ